jgi:hypothetical protein
MTGFVLPDSILIAAGGLLYNLWADTHVSPCKNFSILNFESLYSKLFSNLLNSGFGILTSGF